MVSGRYASSRDILGYHHDRRSILADVLVRGIPEHVVAVIEANAKRAGLSRAEYIRRLLEREQHHARHDVTLNSLRRFHAMFCDLQDPDVMSSAWS